MGDTAEGVATDLLGRDLGKEAFHLVEPAGVGRDEMHLPAWVARDPLAHRCGLVSRVVVQDHMHFHFGWCLFLNLS